MLNKATKIKKLKKSHVESDGNNDAPDRILFNNHVSDLRESHLSILSIHDFVADTVIDFYAGVLLENASSNRSTFYFNTSYSSLAQSGQFNFGNQASSIARSNVLIFPLNWANVHWRLLVVVNVLDDHKQTEALFFDSSFSNFNPEHQVNNVTGETESVSIIVWVNRLIRWLKEPIDANPLNEVSELKIVKCTQQAGHDCALCLLKNYEIVLENQDAMLNSNDTLAFFNNEITWYERNEATQLRSIVVATARSLSIIGSAND